MKAGYQVNLSLNKQDKDNLIKCRDNNYTNIEIFRDGLAKVIREIERGKANG